MGSGLFGGSGTTADAAQELGRYFLTIDSNPEAVEVMKNRFASKNVDFVVYGTNDLEDSEEKEQNVLF